MGESGLENAVSRARGEFGQVDVDRRKARLIVSADEAERWAESIQPYQCIRQVNVGEQPEPPFFYHGVTLIAGSSGQRAQDLVRRWRTEDEGEQRETFEFLKQALDEDRPSSRRLFP